MHIEYCYFLVLRSSLGQMYPYYESEWGILPMEHNRRFVISRNCFYTSGSSRSYQLCYQKSDYANHSFYVHIHFLRLSSTLLMRLRKKQSSKQSKVFLLQTMTNFTLDFATQTSTEKFNGRCKFLNWCSNK